ncbi:MAG: prolyl oligopeptidase family serine peptidase, partial [Gemmatimonadetes bacterium]|nr:prolyl oligopeptidase family serine peptidase [Gemmatimonadota bacterium]
RIPWGARARRVALPAGMSIGRLHADPARDGVLLTLDSNVSASLSYSYDPTRDVLVELPLRALGPDHRREGYVAETVLVPSHDGVRVPLSITRPERMVRDGSLRMLMSGYGGYGRTDPPQFVPELAPWYEANGASGPCHVRGGGYYGAAWHQAGQKATKPNSWLDFIACAEYLVREGYTRPERLVATGASAGGITIGRALTERPDLFAGAFIGVGLMDAVRFETTPGGPANVRELGSVSTEEGFRALLTMSPVHHVRPGTAYPAVLLTAGLNDPRVPAWQPGKMAAALQAATTSGRPVLLRIDEAEGHGASSSDEQFRAYLTDFIAFALFATGAGPAPQ